MSGMYGWATGAQSGQNGPFSAPWPDLQFLSFLNFFNGGNGPSIPQNDRKWLRNLNPEPCWQFINHVREISLFVRFWLRSRAAPFLIYAWELGLNIRRPNSSNMGLLTHQNWLMGNHRGKRYWGKRTIVLYITLIVNQYISAKSQWTKIKKVRTKTSFSWEKSSYLIILGPKKSYISDLTRQIHAILMIHNVCFHVYPPIGWLFLLYIKN